MEPSFGRPKHCITKINNSYSTYLLFFEVDVSQDCERIQIYIVYTKSHIKAYFSYIRSLPYPSLFLALFLFFWESWEMLRCPVHSPDCLLHAPPTTPHRETAHQQAQHINNFGYIGSVSSKGILSCAILFLARA